MNLKKLPYLGFVLFFSCQGPAEKFEPQVEISMWKDNKRGAISHTFDDGTINQFTVALPLLDQFGFKGTFYILTGKVPGSQYKGKFIGRDIQEIIKETKSIPTGPDNFFERASAIGYSGYEGAIDFHSRAGSLVDGGKIEEAYQVIDDGYALIRKGKLKGLGEIIYHDNPIDSTTWEDFKNYASGGHEIASHTITHPRLAALDETNMLYELEKSREEILTHLGKASTFSAECPYGTENERVMEYAHKIYPALRNRMPESYLDELNRGSKRNPGESDKEIVQWQRGPLTSITMETMKAWVDTVMRHNNIWLVLVFHGIDGIGWEPRTGDELKEYFGYMKEKEKDLWIGTFAEVTQYMRERKNTRVEAKYDKDKIQIGFSCSLNSELYDVPLTFKISVPEAWDELTVKGGNGEDISFQFFPEQKYVLFNAVPFGGEVVISENNQDE